MEKPAKTDVDEVLRRRPDEFPLAGLSASQLRELERAHQLPGGLRRSAWRGEVLSVR
jgi:hypothetical protein